MDYLATYKRLFAISQAGLQYGQDIFDKERYEELREISLQLLYELGNEPTEPIADLFSHEIGYQTPKVDVRAWIFRNDQVLLVEDRKTKEWSLPGGYADVGYAPSANVEREVREETGLTVKARQLKAVFDTDLRKDIPQTFQYYKLVFECEVLSGYFVENSETTRCEYFSLNNLPKLSIKRTTIEQLKILYEQKGNGYFE